VATVSAGRSLLDAVRWAAVRFMLQWGMGLHPDTALARRIGYALDDYTRTCLEVMPYRSSPPIIGHIIEYFRLYSIARTLKRLTATAVALSTAYATPGGAFSPAPLRLTNQDRIAAQSSSAAKSAGACPFSSFPAGTAFTPEQIKVLHGGAAPSHGTASATASKPASDGSSSNAVSNLNPLSAMVKAGFSLDEITADVNHTHGAHKAIALVTTCALAELSMPAHAHWREAMVSELVAVFGRPPATAFEGAAAEIKKSGRLKGAQMEAAFLHSLQEALVSSGYIPERDVKSVLQAIMQQAVDAQKVVEEKYPSASSGSSAATTVWPPPLASLPKGWRAPDRRDAEKMIDILPVTYRVWRETLRRHVVSMGAMRKLGEDMEIVVTPTPAWTESATKGDAPVPARMSDSITLCLKKGQEVNIMLHTIHNLPAFWGPRAEEWNPDRWLPDASEDLKPRATNTFIPFLDGVRRCAGMYIAEMQFICMIYAFLVPYQVRVAIPPSRTDQSPTHAPEYDSHTGLVDYGICSLETHEESALVPLNPQRPHSGHLKLRMRPEMFSAIDGQLPFMVDCEDAEY
jgi:hypothetical protein